MPQRTTVSRAKEVGQAAYDRLTQSIDAAQTALKDLRKELGKGRSDVLADIERALKDARKELRSRRSGLLSDLKQALTPGGAKKPARRAASTSTSAASSSARSAAASRGDAAA